MIYQQIWQNKRCKKKKKERKSLTKAEWRVYYFQNLQLCVLFPLGLWGWVDHIYQQTRINGSRFFASSIQEIIAESIYNLTLFQGRLRSHFPLLMHSI